MSGDTAGDVPGDTTTSALIRIGLPRRALAPKRPTGLGVSVYVFDGGVATDHPELAGRVRVGFDAFPSDPRLCNGHGTAVAGAIAGNTLGVAPGAEIIDVKIIKCGVDRGSSDAILAAARWTVDDHRRHPERPAVANWSFVVDTSRDVATIDSAITILRDADILVIAAAGNYDIDACRVSPANSGSVLTVGATSLVSADRDAKHRSETRTSGTAWGECVDIYAPGDSISLPTVRNGRASIAIWSGTSMATGFVSGAAAVLLEWRPCTTPEELVQILLSDARPMLAGEQLLERRGRRGGFLRVRIVP